MVVCDERRTLQERFEAAAVAYHEAVVRLNALLGPEYEDAWDRAEKARRLRNQVQRELQEHEEQHGCFLRGRREYADL